MNRCCSCESPSSWVICRCRLSAIALKLVARRARSSSPRTIIRSSSCPSASRWAVPAARRTGSTTSRVTSTPMPTTNSVSATPLMTTVLRISERLSSSWASGKA